MRAPEDELVGVSDDERVAQAQASALELGRRLRIEPVPDTDRFFAYAGRATEERSTGRFLAYGDTPGAAAEKGLDVLRGIVQSDMPWPRRHPVS